MVAENNKEVKKKKDGEGVNCIYEEELHDRTASGSGPRENFMRV